ncbi:MAG: DUF6252 family protein [Flammeovirgaceae bacterium]|nr:DUF6252 family protein [Flammeovirgaceae bacterium]
MSTKPFIPILISVAILLVAVGSSFRLGNNKSATTEKPAMGSNTFSCIINNQPWEVNTLQCELSHDGNIFYLSLWLGDSFQDRLFFVMEAETIKAGTYELNEPGRQYIFLEHHEKECTFQSDTYYNGTLMITTYDTAHQIIAGNFEFLAYADDCQEVLRVSKGVFDLKYTTH